MTPSDGFFTNVLDKDSIANFTFEMSYDFSAIGEYEIAVWTELTGDEQVSNDTAYFTLINSSTINQLPYNQTFEGNNNDWYSDAEENISWNLGPSEKGQITPLLISPNNWFITIGSSHNQIDTIYLNSPCLDFSAFNEDPTLSFQYFMNVNDFSNQFWVEVSTDDGVNWRRLLGDETANNWYDNFSESAFIRNTFSWVSASNTLSFTAKEPAVQVRYVFKATAEETAGQKLAIDDIKIQPNFSTATTQLDLVNDFRLYPNPSKGILQLVLALDKTADVQYQIMDVLGRPVFESAVVKGQEIQQTLDFKGEPKGIYFLSVNIDNQLITKKMFLIK